MQCAQCGKPFGLINYGKYRWRQWRFCSQEHLNTFRSDREREGRVAQFLKYLYDKPPYWLSHWNPHL